MASCFSLLHANEHHSMGFVDDNFGRRTECVQPFYLAAPFVLSSTEIATVIRRPQVPTQHNAFVYITARSTNQPRFQLILSQWRREWLMCRYVDFEVTTLGILMFQVLTLSSVFRVVLMAWYTYSMEQGPS